MAQQLKRWESPRRQGRNHRGRGGAARQRQLQKRTQTLRQRLQRGGGQGSPHDQGESFGSPLHSFKGHPGLPAGLARGSGQETFTCP